MPTSPPDPAEVASFTARAPSLLLEHGRRLCEEGRCREALACFEQALRQRPADPELLFWCGQEQLHLAEYGQAEQRLLQAWRAHPGLVGCVRLLARVWLQHLDRPDLAAELIAEARQLHPTHPGLLKSDGDLRLALHEPEQAALLFEQVLRQDPEDEEARDGLATAYNERAFELQRLGQIEEAIFLLRRALGITPGWAGLRVNLGQLFLLLGRTKAAEKEFLQAVAQDERDPIACFNLARLYRQQGQADLAQSWFGRTLALDDDYPDARPELASLLYEQGDHEAAAALLQEEVARDATCPICHHNLGLALLGQGEPEAARRHLERSLALDPSYFRARYNLAALLARAGAGAEALVQLEEAFRLDPATTREWLRLDRADFGELAEHPRLHELID